LNPQRLENHKSRFKKLIDYISQVRISVNDREEAGKLPGESEEDHEIPQNSSTRVTI